jgi:hypothetical protein
MSITFTIAGNHEHTVAAGTMEYDEYDCQRCEFDGKNPECPECKPYGGNGKVRFERLPFEMNVANGNARTLWASLGLTFDYSGQIDGRTLVAAIDSSDPALLVRATTEEGGNGRARVINCGIDPDRAERYRTTLRQIAEEAARREQPVVWG